MKIIHKIFTLLCGFCLFAATTAGGWAKGSEGKFVVVIDAGHGGKDAGACDNNVKEKDINLGVALQLEELLKKKMKDVKVVMTRDNDTFYSLQQRADIANKARGDLFISIHTNSVDASNPNRTTVAGSSVYVLGLHKDQNNMQVARRENSVIQLERNFTENYEGFDPNKDESYIIFEMAQKKNLSQSFKFADEVQKQLVKVAGRRDRGVHQAGFWVLWATSMPSILIELDFITNPNSAKYISSTTGQERLAEGIFKAIQSYRSALKDEAQRALEQESAPVDGENAVAVLAQSESSPRTVSHKTPTAKPVSSRRNTSRKRRSDYARDLSVKRSVETENIKLQSELGDMPQMASARPAAKVDQEPQENFDLKGKKKKNKDKRKKEKKQKEKKVDNKRERTQVASTKGNQTSRRPGVSPYANQSKKKDSKVENHQQNVSVASSRKVQTNLSPDNAANRPSTRSKRMRKTNE